MDPGKLIQTRSIVVHFCNKVSQNLKWLSSQFCETRPDPTEFTIIIDRIDCLTDLYPWDRITKHILIKFLNKLSFESLEREFGDQFLLNLACFLGLLEWRVWLVFFFSDWSRFVPHPVSLLTYVVTIMINIVDVVMYKPIVISHFS